MSVYNRLLRKISGSVWEEITDGCRKLRDEGLHILYLLPNSMQAIESRWM